MYKNLHNCIFGIEEIEVEKKDLTIKEIEEETIRRGHDLDEMVSTNGFKVLYEKIHRDMDVIEKKVFVGVEAENTADIDYFREVLVQQHRVYARLLDWIMGQINEGFKIKEECEKNERDSK